MSRRSPPDQRGLREAGGGNFHRDSPLYEVASIATAPDARQSMATTTHPFDDDHLREECGVFGVFGHPEASALVALGLHALQHRGQEAAGIVAFDGEQFHAHRDLGYVGDIFSSKDVIARLAGHSALGHNRYATT